MSTELIILDWAVHNGQGRWTVRWRHLVHNQWSSQQWCIYTCFLTDRAMFECFKNVHESNTSRWKHKMDVGKPSHNNGKGIGMGGCTSTHPQPTRDPSHMTRRPSGAATFDGAAPPPALVSSNHVIMQAPSVWANGTLSLYTQLDKRLVRARHFL